MTDDSPQHDWPEYFPPPDDDTDESFERPSRFRGCAFAAVSLLLVCSLLTTSVLALFLVRRDSARSNARPTIAALAPLPTPFVIPEAPSAPLEEAAAVAPTALPEPQGAPVVAEPVRPTAEPTRSSPDLNRIVVINLDGQIETVTPDGEDRRVLTRSADDVFFQFPTWSPDGELVAVVGNDPQGGGIYVIPDRRNVDLEDSQVYYSQSQVPFYLYWSPDSRQISFLANHSRNLFGLSVVAVDGVVESELLATGSPIYWEWSANSEQLLVHRVTSSETSSVDWLDLEGGEETVSQNEAGFFQTPGISPSGRYLALAEDDGRNSSLVLVDNNSGRRTRLDSSASMAMTWSPTRDVLAYTGGSLNNHPYWGPLQLLDAATGESRELTRETVLAFFWSPDGRQIATITLNQRGDDSINAGLPKDRRLSRLEPVAQTQTGGFLRLSVMDVETGQGLRLFDFQPSPVFVSQFMPFFGQYALSHRLWSPDSQSIVLPVFDESGELIVVIPVDGGAPRAIAEGEIAFWSPR